jgi:hypothetical protein
MIIIPHKESSDRPWRFRDDQGWYGMFSERLCWARDTFECEVDLRGIASSHFSDGTFEWAFVRAVVGPKQDTPVRPPLMYPELRFEHERIPLAEFMSRLDESGIGDDKNRGKAGRTPPFAIGELRAELGPTGGWWGASTSAGDRICPAPNWHVYRPLGERINPPFVSSTLGHPFYPNKLELYWDLSGMNYIKLNDARLTSFNVVVVDQRGHIEGLNYSEDGLTVRLAGECLDQLTLQLRHSHGAWAGPAAPEVRLPEISLPSLLDFALVSPEHELIDRQTWRAFPVPDETELYALIRGGESEFVEFKPWVAFNGEKFNEIVDTVIAMGNSETGGTLIIGVDDFGRPAAWKGMSDFEAAARIGGANIASQLSMRQAAADCYGHKLIDLLGDRMMPVPPIQRSIREYEGSVLLKLDISPAPIMVTHKINDYVLVRRGASNRHAPRDVLDKLTQRGK